MLGPDGYRERLAGVVENLDRERRARDRVPPRVATDGPAAMGAGAVRLLRHRALEERRLGEQAHRRLVLATADAGFADSCGVPRPDAVSGRARTVDAYCTPEGAQAVFDKASGPKEIEWLDTPNHIDIYDRPELVDPAVQRVARFWRKQLAPRERQPGLSANAEPRSAGEKRWASRFQESRRSTGRHAIGCSSRRSSSGAPQSRGRGET